MTTRASLADILRTALETEHYGHWFYSMAASQCQDAKGKEAFEKLAADELEHVRFLAAQGAALKKTGRLDRRLKLGRSRLATRAGPIFSDQIRSRLGQAHVEMTALAVGLELELSAQRYYGRQARNCSNPYAREFFQKLAHWESGHYQLLAAQQKLLQEDYWQRAGFAPF